MHPQAPNTQTFLPACLLPTACDYNGLDCFDPLERKMTYYYQEATRNSPRRYIPHGLPRGLCATAPAPLLGEKANEIRRRGLQYSRAYLAASLEAQRLKDSNRHTHATPYKLPVDRFLLTLTRFSLSDSPSSRHSTSSITSSSACFELENAFAVTVANVTTAFAPAYIACGFACANTRCT
jgi:hypothetical protein